MNNPLVSILIPVYNRANLVGETIDSAICQTYKDIEIIIVDNCSTDGTWELLKKYEKRDNRIRIFQNDENIGPVRNWRRCIDEAKGEYSKILFSDDIIKETFIENTIRFFDDKTAFVLTGMKIFGLSNITSRFYIKKEVYKSSFYLNEMLLFHTMDFPVSPGCAIFRTSDLKIALHIEIPNEIGLEFSKYGAGNDLLLYLITASRYPEIRVVKSIESFFRAHEDSFTVSNKLNIYYNYSKYYFIVNYYNNVLLKYNIVKEILLIPQRKKITKSLFKNIYKDISFTLIFIFKKLIRTFK